MYKFKIKNKNKVLIIGALLLVISTITIILITNNTDGSKFKKDYEALNNKSSSSGNKYQKLDIDKNNKIKYIDGKEVVEFLKNGTGIIYFGFPECPWCRGILPTLLESIKESHLTEMLYLDVSDIRDTFEVKENQIVKTKNASDEYYEILDLLDHYLDNYVIKDENGIEYEVKEKRLLVPLVVSVKNGIIMDVHKGSVELEEGKTPYDELNELQISELQVIFSNLIEATKDKASCNEYC